MSTRISIVLVLLAVAFVGAFLLVRGDGYAAFHGSGGAQDGLEPVKVSDVELAGAHEPASTSGLARVDIDGPTRISAYVAPALRWRDLIEPVDALDQSPVASAWVRIVDGDGELHSFVLDDAVGPNDLAEGNVGGVGSDLHFTRAFVASELRRSPTVTLDSQSGMAAPRCVALHPHGSIEVVLGEGSAPLLPGSSVNVTRGGRMGIEVDPHFDVLDGRARPNHITLGRILDRCDQLFSDEVDAKWRQRQARWFTSNATGTILLDLDLPPTLGGRNDHHVRLVDGLPLTIGKLPIGAPIRVSCHNSEGRGARVGISEDPTSPPTHFQSSHELAEALRPGEIRTVAIHARVGSVVRGLFPSNSSVRSVDLARHTVGVSWTGPGEVEVDANGSFEAIDLVPGPYVLSAIWTETGGTCCTSMHRFEIRDGDVVDLGVLSVADDTHSIELRPRILVDGEPHEPIEGLRYEIHLGPSPRSTALPSKSRVMRRTDSEPFTIVGLEPHEFYVSTMSIEVEGPRAESYLGHSGRSLLFVDLSNGNASEDIAVELDRTGSAELRVEFPCDDPSLTYQVYGHLIEERRKRSGRIEFQVRRSEDGSNWIAESTPLRGAGTWRLVVVAAFDGNWPPDRPENARIEPPSYVGSIELDVDGPTTATIPLELGACASGTRESFLGPGARRRFCLVGLLGSGIQSRSVWSSELYGEGDEFVFRGLLPNTTYQVAHGDRTFTTGAAGTMTVLEK